MPESIDADSQLLVRAATAAMTMVAATAACLRRTEFTALAVEKHIDRLAYRRSAFIEEHFDAHLLKTGQGTRTHATCGQNFDAGFF